MKPAHPFYMIRHGETDWNARGLSQGNVDIPLNGVGVEQARRAALALQEPGEGRRIVSIVASPLGRAQHTARIVAEALGLDFSTDEELRELDRFVRNNTTERFGPVRAVAPKLVVEVAFEGVNRSARHRSGVALRFPRISRIRWDKPAAEADRLHTLEAML